MSFSQEQLIFSSFVNPEWPWGATVTLSQGGFYLTKQRNKREKRKRARDGREREKKKLWSLSNVKRRFYWILELMVPKRFKGPFTSIQVPWLLPIWWHRQTLWYHSGKELNPINGVRIVNPPIQRSPIAPCVYQAGAQTADANWFPWCRWSQFSWAAHWLGSHRVALPKEEFGT